VVFRENTEGLYVGMEYHPVPQKVWDVMCETLPKQTKRFKDTPLADAAISMRYMTRQGCRNICTDAFEFAKKFNRKSVTLVEKPNVLRETGGLMTRTARAVAKDYPNIPFYEANIDAMCMWLLKNPFDYDILIAENMFGDIISDLCAQLVGGLGFASSGNIGDKFAVFEPTHGSAPKYAGMYKVNPMAMLLTVKLMLDWLGETDYGTAWKRPSRTSSRRARCAPTTWAASPPPWTWRRRWWRGCKPQADEKQAEEKQRSLTNLGRLCCPEQSRAGFHMGRGWGPADSLRRAGEGSALSRLG